MSLEEIPKKIQQDYIMLIMNCKKYEYKANYQKLKWLNKLPSYII